MTEASSTEPQATANFIALGRSGKSAWWRYLLGFLIIIGGFTLFSVALFVVVMVVASGGQLSHIDPSSGHIKGVDPIINYIALNVGFWFLILFSFLVVRFLHGRSFLSLINPAKKLSLQRIGIGFGLWFCLTSIAAIIGSIIYPHDYKYALQSPEFFYYLPIVLFLTPIQCFAEELFFRGYVLQSLGKITNSRWWLCGISGIIFALPHFGNPEVGDNPIPVMLVYFTIGLLLALATIRTNSIEVAIGCHIGNNLFDGLIVNYSKSVLDTRSIFLCTQMHPWYEFSSLAILGTLLYLVIVRYVNPVSDSSATS